MRGDPGEEGYVVHDGDTDNNPGNTLRSFAKDGESKPRRLPPDLTDPKLMFSTTDRAIGFMEQQVKAGQPFYLQISHYAMHAGQECLPATREKYADHPLVQAWYTANNKHKDMVRLGDDPAVWLGMADDLDGRIGAMISLMFECCSNAVRFVGRHGRSPQHRSTRTGNAPATFPRHDELL